MPVASINVKAVSATSEKHNLRQVSLDYVFEDLIPENENWVGQDIASKEKEIHALCKELSGRKMQKNATPIREAVVNLEEHHTMDDVRTMADNLKSRFGIEAFQIHIHRDEGKSREDRNYHAHIVFDWQDKETGKMRRLNKLATSQMQTVVAESLGMQRGELKVNTNRERLEPIEYKREQEEKKLKALQQQVEQLEQKKNTATERNREAGQAYRDAQEANERLERENTEEEERIRERTAELLKTCWKDPDKVHDLAEEEISLVISEINDRIPKVRANIEHYEREGRRLSGAIQQLKQGSSYRELASLQDRIEELATEENEERAKQREIEIKRTMAAKGASAGQILREIERFRKGQ